LKKMMHPSSSSTPAIQPTRPSPAPQPRTARDLTVAQRWLVQIMSEFQFGRILNLRVEHGQPVPDQRLGIIRAARLGSRHDRCKVPVSGDQELKQEVWDLIDEITQLQNGVVVRLEFRHGLPFLLETTARPGDLATEQR
jgi:hypothetical protein